MCKSITRRIGTLLVTASTLLLLIPTLASAELILTAPPRESAEAGQKVYGPLADHLTKVLGTPVVYQQPEDWRAYEKRMKNDEYDIVFDGPHFAAWRIENLQAAPLAKLPGSLKFVLVVQPNDLATRPEDLIGGTICTLPTPNLGALTVYSMYPNPVRQPDFVILKGGFGNVAKQFQAGKCRGAILRKAFYANKLTPADRSKMRVIQESTALTNQGITTSARITPTARKKILQSLTEGDTATHPLLKRFAKKANGFEAASSVDYVGHNLLRDNMIFGW